MDFRQTLAAKILSLIILSLFLWTFGGVYDIAFAAKSGKLTTDSSQPMSKAEHVEKKFERSLEDIEDIIDEVKEKKTKAQRKAAKKRLRAKKREIEEHDTELRKKFKETEEKIKDLPDVIKQRHWDFIKKYEENLNELKANIDDIDRAEDEVKDKVEKAKRHFKKIKKKKKHIPLDPNKLPHRAAEPTKKKPRLKKEEFRNDSDQLTAFGGQLSEQLLVASNGSLGGLLSSPIPNPDTEATMLLAAADPPTDADLAETIEVKFTEAIQAKAAELENNPVKIYNWVRNNIEFVPTYGSIQGADYCLQTLQCNAFDSSSLLIALLRVSNIHARYVYGTVNLPIDKYMNWVGNFTDENAALSFAASGGIPIGGLTDAGKIIEAQMEHMWVEAFVDYFPSRGARHNAGEGDMWVSLDPSYKQYNYTEGIDIKSAVPFDAQSFVDQLQASATINEAEGYVTGLDSLLIQQTMDDYKTRVENYMSQNITNATVGDVLGKKEIIKQEFSYLLGTLPYRTAVVGTKYSEISNNLRHKLSFSVSLSNLFYDASPLTFTKTLPELAGKKITLSYSPATQADEDVINSYLPKPHPDGTPIDPSELPQSLPAYLINLKPELRIDGQVVATGGSVMMGLTENFNMIFTHPTHSSDSVSNLIEAGEYLGIVLDPGVISEKMLNSARNNLETLKNKLDSNNTDNILKDDIIGNLLFATILSYYAELDAINYVTAKNIGVNVIRLPSEGIFSYELDIATSFYDVPLSASPAGLAMDVDHNINLVKAYDGANEKKIQFTITSGMNSSALEHEIPERIFSTSNDKAEGISALKAIKIANDLGIPIYTLNKDNVNSLLPELQIDLNAKADIRNAVNAGKIVTVPKRSINYSGWSGVGYIVIDERTGNGAYMISGGLNGGWIILGLIVALLIKFGIALIITAVFIGGAPIWVPIVGAILVGLGIGLLLSQLLSQDIKDELSKLARVLLRGGLAWLAVMVFVFAWYVAAIALILLIIYEVLKQQSTLYYRRKWDGLQRQIYA